MITEHDINKLAAVQSKRPPTNAGLVLGHAVMELRRQSLYGKRVPRKPKQ